MQSRRGLLKALGLGGVGVAVGASAALKESIADSPVASEFCDDIDRQLSGLEPPVEPPVEPQHEPYSVTFTVQGIESGDRVLVAPSNGQGGIDFEQLKLWNSLRGVAETEVVVTPAIPLDIPASGSIRIVMEDGTHKRVPYTSFSGSTFNISPTDFSENPACVCSNVWIPYIDTKTEKPSESFTCNYSVDRPLLVRVRNAGPTPIKPFETQSTLSATGGTVTMVRVPDILYHN